MILGTQGQIALAGSWAKFVVQRHVQVFDGLLKDFLCLTTQIVTGGGIGPSIGKCGRLSQLGSSTAYITTVVLVR